MLIILGACLGLGSCMVGVVVGGGGVTNLPPPFLLAEVINQK